MFGHFQKYFVEIIIRMCTNIQGSLVKGGFHLEKFIFAETLLFRWSSSIIGEVGVLWSTVIIT